MKHLWIAGFGLGLGIVSQYFFYDHALGVSLLIFSCFVILGLVIGLKWYRQQVPRALLPFLIAWLFFAGLAAVRTSGFLVFWNVIAVYLLALMVVQQAGGARPITSLFGYGKLCFLPLIFPSHTLKLAQELKVPHETHKTQTVMPILRGLLIALPVLVVFALLFSSADLVFQKYLSAIFHLSIDANIYARVILAVLMTILFTGAYRRIFRGQPPAEPESIASNQRLGMIEARVVLGSIATLFLLFVILQLTYLFGGEHFIQEQGFTYADYARRGFFELITVSVISFCVLHLTEQSVKLSADGHHSRWFGSLSVILVVELVAIMFSAHRRLVLYEDAYGFTTDRFYSHVFLLLLVVIFGLLLVRIFQLQTTRLFAERFVWVSLLFLAILNLINPEKIIAKHNLDRYAQTGKIDVNYLAYLSDDALPVTIKLLDNSNDHTRRSFAQRLAYRDFTLISTSGWQSWNLARQAANRLIHEHQDFIQANRDYDPNFVCIPLADATGQFLVPELDPPPRECPAGTVLILDQASQPTSLPSL